MTVATFVCVNMRPVLVGSTLLAVSWVPLQVISSPTVHCNMIQFTDNWFLDTIHPSLASGKYTTGRTTTEPLYTRMLGPKLTACFTIIILVNLTDKKWYLLNSKSHLSWNRLASEFKKQQLKFYNRQIKYL